MTRLSVNINKIATLRNSRGGNNPDVVQTAIDIQRFGADGITVHPRPDERHIRYDDVRALRKVVTQELNIEGNCREPRFVALVLEVVPEQVTLVPDAEGQLTSDHGWNTIVHCEYLREMVSVFRTAGIRTSIFCDPDPAMVAGAAEVGTDRIELYTEPYAAGYAADRASAIRPFVEAATEARRLGLGLNAGHDLSLVNLGYLSQQIPWLDEVSISHALISDALYYSLQNTVQMYRRLLANQA